MKRFLAILLALTLVLGLAACGAKSEQSNESTNSTTTTPKTDKTPQIPMDSDDEGLMHFTVTVVHADGSTKEFAYKTADKYVGIVLKEVGLIKGNDGPYGLEITEVDGEKAVYAEDKAYWAIYVGDEYALTGIDTTPVEEGGVYKLVYTRG